MNKLSIFIIAFLISIPLIGQDTTTITTFTYDSTARRAVFEFPNEGDSYEKILMEYAMRCHDLAVGNGATGCREWDYHCNTVLTDSTMVDSIIAYNPSYSFGTYEGDVLEYTSQQTYSFREIQQFETEVLGVENRNTVGIEAGVFDVKDLFDANNDYCKAQYLYTADQLLANGLAAGKINGLLFRIMEQGSKLDFLSIKLKNSNKSELDVSNPDLDGFQEVYFLNTEFTVGENDLVFYEPFEWDGVSNILIEISYTNTSDGAVNVVLGEKLTSNLGIISYGNDEYAAKFAGTHSLRLELEDFSSIEDEISVACWTFGDPNILPVNTYLFEGVDEKNQRQVNVHLPWGDEVVYWDCGNDGSGYDRINKGVPSSVYKDAWSFWTFTKNAATGEMHIYLNGELWHSGTAKNRKIDLKTFSIGSNKGANSFYYGLVDEFSIWNKALEAEEIQEIMHSSINALNPNYENLVSYFPFNEGAGSSTQDASANGNLETFSGVPAWSKNWGAETNKNFINSEYRPNIGLLQGDYNVSVNEIYVLDSTANAPLQVISYAVEGSDLFVVDTSYLFESGTFDIVSESSNSGSVTYETEGTLTIDELTHYRKTPARFELLSFITPYGNGLDLGPDGKRWTFDVSDFGPILKGKKELSIEGVGNNQEEMEIKFHFIKGTPPHDVLSIQNIWPIRTAGGVWYGFGYPDIVENRSFEERSVKLNPTASNYKVKTAVTGHGQNGEFTARTHFININGDEKEFEWSSWKECGDNPVYPQGGTWIFDRAGWCPGMATDVEEFDITEFVNQSDEVLIDYGINAVSNLADADYRPSVQLVSYGAPNFDLEAAIVEVQRPSKRVEYERANPACNNPIVVVQNNGETALTELEIIYQVPGAELASYTWTGELAFLEKEEIALPIDDPYFFRGGEEDKDNYFYAGIVSVNGTTDEVNENNFYRSGFNPSDVFDENIVINLKTNNWAHENSYSVTNPNGDVILDKDDLDANTTYDDEIDLETDGCYRFNLDDSGDSGLYFWYYTTAVSGQNQGGGYVRFQNASGANLKIFEADFGSFIDYDFAVYNNAPDSTDHKPLDSLFIERFNIVQDSIDMPIDTTDMPVDTTDMPVDTTDMPVDTTDMPVDTTDMPVDTTDMPVDTTEMPIDTTDVINGINDLGYKLFRSYPNPTESTLFIELHGYQEKQISLDLYNTLGQRLQNRKLENLPTIHTLEIDMRNLPPGLYYLKMYDGEKIRVKEIMKE